MEKALGILFISLYTFFFFGGFAILYSLIAGCIVFRKLRKLFPAFLVLLAYQALSVTIIFPQFIPGLVTFIALAGVLPLILGIGSCIWGWKKMDTKREKGIAITLIILGYFLTAFQVFFYITAIWGTI
ncbi:hypothetical protein [Kistimonas asteriae]|uniref:hypothetical protein n=1 Tax=Kistimonas asteriae TaxID=517724 RepID=UPI001BABE03C|nr:hypothetical protein [Kistimonas asteriae]